MEEINYEDLKAGVNINNIRSYYFYTEEGKSYIEVYYNSGTSQKQVIRSGYEVAVKKAFFECLESCVSNGYKMINFFKNNGIYDIKVCSKKRKNNKSK